jgi:D-amino-acid dehydrogenase
LTGYDLAVVGGGLVGTALAYEAGRAGARTVLVDRADRGRATDAGAGILSPETTGAPDAGWFALAVGAGEHYRGLVGDLEAAGVGPTGYEPCAVLRISFREAEDQLWAEHRARIMERSGTVLEELDPARAPELFPPLASARGAILNPNAARVDGRTLNAALRAAAVGVGVTVVEGAVHGIDASGDRVDAVVTDAGALACDAVAIAGGAWTPALAALLGVTLPVAPVRGQIVHLRLEGVETEGWPILQPLISHYAVPWAGGRVAVGATFEPDAGFDARPTAGGFRILFSEMLRLAPGLADATVVEVRVGLRPVSVDDAPILGALPGWENAFVCTGHGANGLLLGPYSARLTADLALGRHPALDLTPFGVARFGDSPVA